MTKQVVNGSERMDIKGLMMNSSSGQLSTRKELIRMIDPFMKMEMEKKKRVEKNRENQRKT